VKSPFPGMDPYLEARWSDVHVRLIAYASEAIQSLLPSALRARSEERVLLETTDDQERAGDYRSDIAVVDTGRRAASASPASGAAATVEPILVQYHQGPEVDRFIQIIDRTSGNRVVTVVEILSPWNKGSGRGNKDYLRKLDDYARGGVNVVEIDLLRHPTRDRLQVSQLDLPAARRTPYLTSVRRAGTPDQWAVYPMPLREPLPRIPIPLRPTDADVGLELQPLIDRVYTAGGHDDIDYTKLPTPPLDPDDAAWAAQLLQTAGKL
jgi:hypothetical protein